MRWMAAGFPITRFPEFLSKMIAIAPSTLSCTVLPEKMNRKPGQTRGWFNLDAGQKKYAADGHNRYVYFYGETRHAYQQIWAGDIYQWFEGKRYGFFKVDTGTKLVDFTQKVYLRLKASSISEYEEPGPLTFKAKSFTCRTIYLYPFS